MPLIQVNNIVIINLNLPHIKTHCDGGHSHHTHTRTHTQQNRIYNGRNTIGGKLTRCRRTYSARFICIFFIIGTQTLRRTECNNSQTHLSTHTHQPSVPSLLGTTRVRSCLPNHLDDATVVRSGRTSSFYTRSRYYCRVAVALQKKKKKNLRQNPHPIPYSFRCADHAQPAGALPGVSVCVFFMLFKQTRTQLGRSISGR